MLESEIIEIQNGEKKLFALIIQDDWIGDGKWCAITPFRMVQVNQVYPHAWGEIRIFRKEKHLKILEIWNTRTIPKNLLSGCRIFGTIPSEEIKDIKKILGHLLFGVKIPKNLWLKMGDTIKDNNDPRLEFQKESSKILDQLSDLAEKCS